MGSKPRTTPLCHTLVVRGKGSVFAFLLAALFIPLPQAFAAPTVTITQPASGSTVPQGGFLFSGQAQDPSGVSEVRVYVYDASSKTYTVSNQEATYDPSTETWSFQVLPSHMRAGSSVYLYVRAKATSGNWSPWQSRRAVVEPDPNVDGTPPTITITYPASGQEVSKGGFLFSGNAQDLSGVSEARVYVYDVSSKQYTVSNQPATYDPSANTWSYEVLPTHIRAGSSVQLYARAKDTKGNWSSWQYQRALIEADPNIDGTPPTVTITQPAQGQEVSKNGFLFSGQAQDPSGVTEVRVHIYDGLKHAYTVQSQLANYDPSTNVWSFQVLPTHITPGMDVFLMVRAKDVHGNWSGSIKRTVTVERASQEDLLPPQVTLTAPAIEEEVSKDGFLFTGQAQDQNGVTEVRIDVYDFARRQYTVRSQLASYDPSTSTWFFQVLPTHITPGSKAYLFVAARDSFNNWSSRQTGLVTIEPDSGDTDIAPPILAITSPTLGQIVSDEGFNFEGTVMDLQSEIEEVRIYVYDFSQRKFTVVSQPASFDSQTSIWRFNVLASHITRNSNATLWAKGKDTAGYWSKWENVLVSVRDLTPPVTTVSPEGGVFNEAIDVTLTTNEPATIYYTLDGTDPTTSSPTYTAPIHMEQDTTLKFFAVDDGGNMEPIRTETYTVRVGSAIILEPSDNATVSGTIAIKGLANHPSFYYWGLLLDDGSGNLVQQLALGFQRLLPDASGNPPTLVTWNSWQYPDGVYQLRLQVFDQGSNIVKEARTSVTVKLDPATAFAQIVEPLDGATVSGTIAIKGLADHPGFSYWQLSLDDGSGNQTQLAFGFQRLLPDAEGNPPTLATWNSWENPDGIYQLRLQVFDTNGTVAKEAVTSVTVKLDPATAFAQIVEPVDGATVSGTIAIKGLADHPDFFYWVLLLDDGSGNLVQLALGFQRLLPDLEGNPPTLANWTSWQYPDGIYQLKLQVFDQGSNILKEAATSVTVKLDPATAFAQIVEPVDGATVSGTIAIKGLADHPGFSIWTLFADDGSGNVISLALGFEPALPDALGNPPTLASWNTWEYPDGVYQLTLQVFDLDGTIGKESRITLTVDKSVLGFLFPQATEPLFSPNQDGVKDTTIITAELTAPADWTVTIKDAANQVIKSTSGQGTTISFTWNGEDESNLRVPDGTYTWSITATDPLTGTTANPVSVSGQVEVDTVIDTSEILEPISGANLSGTVPIKGLAHDQNFYVWFLEQGPLGTTAWSGINTLAYQYAPAVLDAFGNPPTLANWNTSVLVSGDYELRIRVQDHAGNLSDTRIPVLLYNVVINDAQVSDSIFSPNGDGKKDSTTISAALTGPFDWAAEIKNSSDQVVRTLSSAQRESAINAVWDGKDQMNQVVPDGVYTWVINAADPETSVQATPVSGNVTVDVTVPVAEISAPLEGAIVHGDSIPVTGTASDAQIESYQLDFGAGVSPTAWTQIVSSSTSVSGGTLGFWEPRGLNDGLYTLRLVVDDQALNSASDTVTVTLDQLEITNIVATPQLIRTDRGETVTISYDLEVPARVTLNIFKGLMTVGQLGFGGFQKEYLLSLLNSEPQSAGPHQVVWNGSDASGNPVPRAVYVYEIIAQDSQGRTGTYAPEYVFAVPEVTNVSITNGDPYRNIPYQFHFTLNEASWTLVGARALGFIVDENFHPAGPATVFWNGRNTLTGQIFDFRLIVGFPYFFNQPFVVQAFVLPVNSIVVERDLVAVSNLTAEAFLITPPFNQVSAIRYELDRPAVVSIDILDPNGNFFRTLAVNESLSQGPQEHVWDGTDASGRLAFLEGDYRVKVSAENASGNPPTIATANLKVRR